MNDLDQAVAAFRERMQGVTPGDVLGPLNGEVPPGFQLVVLDALPDGSLVFSLPFGETPRIVPDSRGPFRWSDDAETFIDPRGDPHVLIDLDTLVAKTAYPSLAIAYQRMKVFVAEHPVVGTEVADALLGAEQDLIMRLDYLLFAPGPRAAEDNFVRCCQFILGGETGTRLSDREQALLVMVMNNILIRCLRNTGVVRVVKTAAPDTTPPPDQAVQQR